VADSKIGKTPDGREATVESWNTQCPVGTPVRYWPVLPAIESCQPIESTTRSEAWMLGSGHGVVKIVGKVGGVHLLHLEVIDAVRHVDTPANGPKPWEIPYTAKERADLRAHCMVWPETYEHMERLRYEATLEVADARIAQLEARDKLRQQIAEAREEIFEKVVAVAQDVLAWLRRTDRGGTAHERELSKVLEPYQSRSTEVAKS